MLGYSCIEKDGDFKKNEIFYVPNEHWTNDDNKEFYEKLSIEEFKLFAKRGGLDSCCDLELLKPYWSKANSILEVGAGYGRVIDYLIENGFSGEITGIERCHSYFEYLKKNYGKKITLLKDNLLSYFFMKKKFDLILFLWGGICDFTPKEQLQIIKSLGNSLTKKGKLILDTIPSFIQPLKSIKNGNRLYLIELNNTTIQVHLPSHVEINIYAKKAGLFHCDCITYYSKIRRIRYLYILG